MSATTNLLLLTLILGSTALRAEDNWQPFDPAVISRLSVDEVPRSLAICQGKKIWLAYDLERASLMKCCRADKPGDGLIQKTFTTASKGTILWTPSRADGSAWTLKDAPDSALSIRYLGCKDLRSHILLTWQLRSDSRDLQLEERIPVDKAGDALLIREIRVSGLQKGDSLMPQELQSKKWQLLDSDGKTQSGIQSGAWHQLLLHP